MTDVDPVIELTEWWMQAALTETGMVCRKAVEYGATDLRDLGREIYEMAGRPQPDDATATETGIAFYVLGKLGRVTAAVKEGRRPSLDTWIDIGVYARMAQRVHEAGGWPAVGKIEPYSPSREWNEAMAGAQEAFERGLGAVEAAPGWPPSSPRARFDPAPADLEMDKLATYLSGIDAGQGQAETPVDVAIRIIRDLTSISAEMTRLSPVPGEIRVNAPSHHWLMDDGARADGQPSPDGLKNILDEVDAALDVTERRPDPPVDSDDPAYGSIPRQPVNYDLEPPF